MEILERIIRDRIEHVWFDEWTNLDRDWQDIIVKDLIFMWRTDTEWHEKGVQAMLKEHHKRVNNGSPGILFRYAESVAHYYY